MQVDINKFVDWWLKMDSEGGPAGLAMWGELDSGNDRLNMAMDELEAALREVHEIVSAIESTYSEEIDKLLEEREY